MIGYFTNLKSNVDEPGFFQERRSSVRFLFLLNQSRKGISGFYAKEKIKKNAMVQMTYHIHNQVTTHTAFISSLLETRILKNEKKKMIKSEKKKKSIKAKARKDSLIYLHYLYSD